MRSKILLNLFFVLSFVGCGIKMGEKIPVNTIAEVQSVKCLDQSIANLKLYFKATATDEQASSAFLCLQDVLVAFKDNIRGANKEAFTPQEVAHFIENNFIHDGTKFSPDFLTAFMKFKVAFIGGEANYINKDEIRQVIDILARLTPDLVRLNKSMKILTFKWDVSDQPQDPTEKEQRLLTAQADFANVLSQITSQFAKQDTAYQTDDIVKFAKEISIFAKVDADTIDTVSKLQGVAGKAKLALLGGQPALNKQDWLTLTTVVDQGLFQALRYKYFIHDLSDEKKVEVWKQADKVTTDTLSLVTFLLNTKDTHVITTDELVAVVDELTKSDLISSDIQSGNVRLALDGLWSNLFVAPETRLQGKILPGLNTDALQTISKHAFSFIHLQQSIAQIFEVNSEFRQNEIHEALQTTSEGPAISPELQKGLNELSQVLNSKIALTFNDDNFLKILTADAGIYHYKDILFSNLARGLSHWLIESYANDLTRVTSLVGVTQSEAEFAFAQFKGLALDFDVIDPKTANTFIASRFREANLFLTSSNGDQYANFIELHDIILHILSGVNRANSGKEAIAKACLDNYTPGMKLRSTTAVPEDKLLNFYLNETHMFKDLPGFLNMKIQFSDDQRKEYFMNLLKAAGHVPNADHVVYLGDANLFPHVIQYVEMLYASYDLATGDVSADSILTKDEAELAFPIFKDTIGQVVQVINPNVKEDQYEGVFMYLLKYGKAPKTLAEKLAFASFISKPEKWIINTSRLDLGMIFNTIADATAPKPSVTPAPVVQPPPSVVQPSIAAVVTPAMANP